MRVILPFLFILNIACQSNGNRLNPIQISIIPSFSEECLIVDDGTKYTGHIIGNRKHRQNRDTLFTFQLETTPELEQSLKYLLSAKEPEKDMIDGLTIILSGSNNLRPNIVNNVEVIQRSKIFKVLANAVQFNSLPELYFTEIEHFYFSHESIPISREKDFKKLLEFREQNRHN